MKMLSVYLISASLLTACTSNSDNFEKFWAEKKEAGLTGAWASAGHSCSQVNAYFQFKGNELTVLKEDENLDFTSSPPMFFFKNFQTQHTAKADGFHFTIHMKPNQPGAEWHKFEFAAYSKDKLQLVNAVGLHLRNNARLADRFNLTRCFDL